jgi:hypothetical protein
MATTPNYGWVTPAPTDFVTDLPADFEIFADAVDASFAADEGDLLVGGTSNIFEPLPIGAAGTVLTSDGDTATWSAPPTGGKPILQIVTASTTTSTQVASTTLADTTLTATITPTSNTSKILVLITQHYRMNRAGTNIGAKYIVLRNSTTIVDYATSTIALSEISILGAATTNTRWSGLAGISYLDSPNTTSAVTYKTQGAASNAADSGSVTFQFDSQPSLITLIEIGD